MCGEGEVGRGERGWRQKRAERGGGKEGEREEEREGEREGI